MASNILPVRDGAITDWRFACGSSPEEIEGTLTAYKQATERNRVSREFGRAYMRLQYTLPASDTDVRLVLRTAHNPLRVDVDGQTALLNGYGDASFTGNSYQSISLKAGDERTLDIYLYAPLAFSLEAYVEPGEIAAGESFFRYIGFGVSAALLLFGAALFLFSLLLAARERAYPGACSCCPPPSLPGARWLCCTPIRRRPPCCRPLSGSPSCCLPNWR